MISSSLRCTAGLQISREISSPGFDGFSYEVTPMTTWPGYLHDSDINGILIKLQILSEWFSTTSLMI